jgi:nitrite reductase (NO-forming)
MPKFRLASVLLLFGPVLAACRGEPGPIESMRIEDDVPVDRTVTLVANSNEIVLTDGIVKRAMTWNGTSPGPQIVVTEGDVVEITVVNEDVIPHGLSVHAAHMYTSGDVGQVMPGEMASLRFRATVPGVYMYHCAPGGHAIAQHVIGGMHGMIVVKPRHDRYQLERRLGRGPDIEMFMLQHEIYANGMDAKNSSPLYVAFNGGVFRYVTEPILARPGDYVRVYYLNVGPNLTGTFHLVGIVWDHMYYQGHPRNVMHGGQTTVAGPSDSWVAEFRVPEPGVYGIVTHSMGDQKARGALGLLVAEEDGARTTATDTQGYDLPIPAGDALRRIVDPFGVGTPDLDRPVRAERQEDAFISMVNNSYYPAVLDVPAGTTVTWQNEDPFELLEGEFTGRHNVVTFGDPPAPVASPILRHAENWSHTFTAAGEYDYLCTLHPYMQGRIRVN